MTHEPGALLYWNNFGTVQSGVVNDVGERNRAWIEGIDMTELKIGDRLQPCCNSDLFTTEKEALKAAKLYAQNLIKFINIRLKAA